MLHAVFTAGVDEIEVSGLTQWDRGQMLSISCPGLPSIYQVHFTYKGAKTALMVPVLDDNTAEIPDELLHQPRDLVAYVYLIGEDGSGETVKTINLPLVPRAKPEDYTADLTPSQMERIEAMLAEINLKAEDAVATSQTADGKADNAVATANRAEANSAAAEQSASAAQTAASNAVDEAAAAKEASQQAEAQAAAVVEVANEANKNAQEALDTANEMAEEVLGSMDNLNLSPAGTGTLYVYCKDEAGEPVSGCVVQIGEELAVTGASGAVKYFLAPGTYSVTIVSPIDYGAEAQTKSVAVALGEVVSIEATIQDSMDGVTELRLTSAVVAAFSGRVTSADAFGVGGGGSGAVASRVNSNGNYLYAAAAGGGGGHTKTVKSIRLGVVLSLAVGTGGAAVSAVNGASYDGKSGGNTVISVLGTGEILLSAPGGDGGTGRSGVGGSGSLGVDGADGGSGSGAAVHSTVSKDQQVGDSGSDGADGESCTSDGGHPGGSGQGTTTRAFGETDGELFSPAGGSVSQLIGNIMLGNCADGAGVGAGAYSSDSGTAANAIAEDATTPGGGGGGAVCVVYGNSNYTHSSQSGAGADGLIIFRWEVAA